MSQPTYGDHLEAAIRSRFVQADQLWAEMAQIREALLVHYRFDAGAIRYFTLHAERSAGDSGMAQAALTSLLPLPSPPALLRQAELSYRVYWALLYGLQLLSEESS